MHCCPSYKTHIIHEGILDVPVDEFGSHPKNQLWSSEQTVRRFLKRNGYCRGKKKLQYFLSEANMQKRDIFLRTLIKNRAKSNKQCLREVYLDESYIHHHYKWKEGEDLVTPVTNWTWTLPKTNTRERGTASSVLSKHLQHAPET